jgi:predicted NAD/FAD-binding protein
MENNGLEWAGTNLASVFAQKRNLLRPNFIRMVKDIVRFNRETTELMKIEPAISGTLENYLDENNYSATFRDWYLLPMAAAIWSSPTQQILAFPLKTFLRFCHNHGLLQVKDRPQWRTVIGGGREYVKRMALTLSDIRLNTPVRQILRGKNFISLDTDTTSGEKFDHVILAAHSDQSLALLQDADADERELLGSIKYQPNTAILHTDASFLPRHKVAHAAWNFHAGYGESADRSAAVTYLINKLQPLPFSQPVMVTLNPHREPDEASIIQRLEYSHPLFDEAAIKAQKKIETLQGRRNTWYCGAWTRYGFHEDGLMSGLHVASFFGAVSAWQQVAS